ncbi:hypothetical protein [Bacteriophage Phi NF-1]|uniref:Uncharacterized protein n=1 Tax=Bacteriophage Phi NF-1 TaxID=2900273 RepID=A0A976QY03_9CAUD|nr:hypothetical protein [Bacteriophage Phi NF-1]
MQFNTREFIELAESSAECLEYVKSGEFGQEPAHVLDDLIVDLQLCLTCTEQARHTMHDILDVLRQKREEV